MAAIQARNRQKALVLVEASDSPIGALSYLPTGGGNAVYSAAHSKENLSSDSPHRRWSSLAPSASAQR